MIKKIKTFLQVILGPMPLNDNFKNYDQYWINRDFNNADVPAVNRAQKISKFIEQNSTILDIGCGSGSVIDYLSKNKKCKKIVGIDISKEAVNYVRKNGYEAHEVDISTDAFIKFIDGKKFDYIIITEVLEHIQDPERIIMTIKNHFNKSIFISIPNSGFFVHRFRLLIGKFPIVVIAQHVKEHIRFWTLSDFVYWLDFFGLSVQKIVSLNSASLVFLGKILPSLFSNQLLFKISLKK